MTITITPSYTLETYIPEYLTNRSYSNKIWKIDYEMVNVFNTAFIYHSNKIHILTFHTQYISYMEKVVKLHNENLLLGVPDSDFITNKDRYKTLHVKIKTSSYQAQFGKHTIDFNNFFKNNYSLEYPHIK